MVFGRVVSLLVGMLVLAACAGENVENEDLGAPLTPAGEVRGDCELTWSADESEIYYISSPLTGPTSLRAAKTDGTGTRVIDDSKFEYWTLLMPYDRSSLYYTALESGRSVRSLYEAFDPREIIGIVLDEKADVIAAAPDGHHLAFWSGGKLRFAGANGGASIALAEGEPRVSNTAGNHEVITFAPAGDQLFFLFSDKSGRYQGDVVDLASGNIEPKGLSDGSWPAVHWDEAGIRILWASMNGRNVTYHIENVTTGASNPVGQLPDGEMSTRHVWSPDGRKVAIWVGRCVEPGGSIDSCRKYVADLFVSDTTTGSASWIARTTGGTGTLAFAPDGRRVAYVTHQRLYVSDTP